MPATILMSGLRRRYGCAESTIYEWMLKDFPRPAGKVGRANAWSMPDVEAWEKIHLPGLHLGPEERFDAFDEEYRWAEIRAGLKRFEDERNKDRASRLSKRATKPAKRH